MNQIQIAYQIRGQVLPIAFEGSYFAYSQLLEKATTAIILIATKTINTPAAAINATFLTF